MTIKEYRKQCKMTQAQAAEYLHTPKKTYFRYETDPKYEGSLKYMKMCEILSEKCRVDETHGILTIEEIKQRISNVLNLYSDITFCYLFGSYAKNKAGESSDIDLMIDSDITGLRYYGLLQELQDSLRKRIDLLKVKDVAGNLELLNEILSSGVKIYG